MSKLLKAGSLIFIILFLDQILKIWIKTNFMLGEEISIAGNWFKIHFTENPGMAFGMELKFLGEYGKMFLTIFRAIAIVFIGWYLVKLAKRQESLGFVLCLAMIFAGATGNLIDSTIYGVIFDSSWGQLAQFMPEAGGYGSFLEGSVVDMFYFPLFKGHFPEWFPFWASEQFIFFRPVFNIADASITVGVFTILIFQKRFFPEPIKEEKTIVNG